MSVSLFHFFITFNPRSVDHVPVLWFPPPHFEEKGKMWSKWKHSFSLYIHPYSKFCQIFEQLAIRMYKLIKQIFCRGKQQCKGNAWGLASIYMYVSPLIPLLLLCMPYPLTISFLVSKNSVYSNENHWMVGNGCWILVNF